VLETGGAVETEEDEPVGEEDFVTLLKETFEAEEIEESDK
jgi:hypothetical protein